MKIYTDQSDDLLVYEVDGNGYPFTLSLHSAICDGERYTENEIRTGGFGCMDFEKIKATANLTEETA